MKLDELGRRLREERIVHGGRLKRGGVRELRRALAHWDARGRRAFVLMVPEGKALAPYRAVANAMSLNRATELLLICNGRRWEAAGWGLPSARLAAVLRDSEAALGQYWAKGLVAALDGAGAAALGAARDAAGVAALGDARSEGGGLVPWGVGGILGVAALGSAGWVIARRRKRMAEESQQFGDAVLAAQARSAEIMLDSEALRHELTAAIQTSAGRIHDELQQLSERRGAEPSKLKVDLARVHQLNNELSTLDSRVMAERRRGSER